MTVPGFDTRLDGLWQANLLRHLDVPPQRVLDVAGGNGLDAIRLAERGHEVTVLDPAGAMLRNAMEEADAAGVADRVHVVQAAAEDAPELFGADEFDAVLCHNLVQFAEDRRALLAAIMAPLRRDGLLSVLAPNSDGRAAELMECLVELGFGLVLRYGVGVLPDDEPPDELAEQALAGRMPYLLTARLVHLVAQR